jgi:hypothetical protein
MLRRLNTAPCSGVWTRIMPTADNRTGDQPLKIDKLQT